MCAGSPYNHLLMYILLPVKATEKKMLNVGAGVLFSFCAKDTCFVLSMFCFYTQINSAKQKTLLCVPTLRIHDPNNPDASNELVFSCCRRGV